MIRGCVERMGKAISRYKGGNERAASMVVQNAINHNELLRMHMSKEDNMLFLLAEERLSEEQKRELVGKFEVLDSEKIGPGRYEAFYHLLNGLEAIYLKD